MYHRVLLYCSPCHISTTWFITGGQIGDGGERGGSEGTEEKEGRKGEGKWGRKRTDREKGKRGQKKGQIEGSASGVT